MEPKTGPVVLDCGHSTVVDVTSDEVYCYRCMRVATVTERAAEYVAACLGCHWKKPFGLAKLNAQLAADKHARRKRHRAQVWHGAKLLDERGPEAVGQLCFNGMPVAGPETVVERRQRLSGRSYPG